MPTPGRCESCDKPTTSVKARLCGRCWNARKRALDIAAHEARAADPEWREFWRELRNEAAADLDGS